MNKLWKYKRFLTLDEVADYLSTKFNAEVQRVDVERYFLDGHLIGSVIANHWHCFILNADDTKITVQGEDPNYFSAYENKPFRLPDEIISGVFQIDPKELESNRKYIIIKLNDGKKAACYVVKYSNCIETENDQITKMTYKSSFQEKLDMIDVAFKSQPKSKDIQKTCANYDRPEFSAENIVIQPSNLESFILEVNNEKSEKAVSPRERHSMELIILALAKEAKYDLSKPHKAAEILQQSAARLGVELPSSRDTIAKYLGAAAKHDL